MGLGEASAISTVRVATSLAVGQTQSAQLMSSNMGLDPKKASSFWQTRRAHKKGLQCGHDNNGPFWLRSPLDIDLVTPAMARNCSKRLAVRVLTTSVSCRQAPLAPSTTACPPNLTSFLT